MAAGRGNARAGPVEADGRGNPKTPATRRYFVAPPTGYYRGAVYHGTIQLIVSPHGRDMNGRWLGFGKNFIVNSGDWHLEWLEA